ncbi:hypothetical protein HanLR1_Chr01g0007591 [Helianthus annuus]|nr:hypothetical protein HanHA89_Chr01g0008561 [Helianthus annuus]KAJ0782386.1 hypothetical protein HanLR1_Chr01g0007591 [Helianthus annuus]
MEGDERSGNKRGRDDEKVIGRLEKRPSVVEEYSYTYSGDEMINGVKYEEEKDTPTKGTGMVTGTGSVSVTSTGTDDIVTSTGTSTCTGTGTGLFDQLITNLVSSPRPDNQSEKGEVAKKGEVVEDGGCEDGKDCGGSESVIDNIVAQLPRTLSGILFFELLLYSYMWFVKNQYFSPLV